MEKSGVKVRDDKDDGLDQVQLENLKAIYGENYDPHTGTFIDPAEEVESGEGKEGEGEATTTTQTTAQSTTQTTTPTKPEPQQQKPTGPKPLFHPQRRSAAAPAQVGK